MKLVVEGGLFFLGVLSQKWSCHEDQKRRSDLLTALLLGCHIAGVSSSTRVAPRRPSLPFKAAALIWLRAEDRGGRESVSQRLM